MKLIEILVVISIQENAFENVVSKMATILSRRQCVDRNTDASLFHFWPHYFSSLEDYSKNTS